MDELIKLALASCVSTLATGVGAWLAFGRKMATREELNGVRVEMVRLVDHNTEAMNSLREEFHQMRVAQEHYNTLFRAYLGLPQEPPG